MRESLLNFSREKGIFPDGGKSTRQENCAKDIIKDVFSMNADFFVHFAIHRAFRLASRKSYYWQQIAEKDARERSFIEYSKAKMFSD